MSPLLIGLIGLVIAFLFLFLRMPIAIAFGTVGFIGMWYLKGLGPALATLQTTPYTRMYYYAWSVIPVFVFMGYLALHTKMAEEFYDGVRRWIGGFRGGLAYAVIAGNTGFGAVSGDPISAAVTFCAFTLPEMRKYGYDDGLTLGCIASGSLLAALIPPSIGFIIYGALTGTSIGKLFIAGIFPGLILAAFYAVVVYFMCRLNPALGPPGPKTTWKDKMTAGTGMWALILVFVIIIGGLYLGLFTPTEAGGAAAFVVLLIGLATRKLSWQGFKTALVDAGKVTAMVGFLVVGCMIFQVFLAITGVQLWLGEVLRLITQSPTGVLLVISFILFILGMIIDVAPLGMLTIPIFFPIVVGMGVNPIHYGVVQGVVMLIGMLTPPVGIVVYALSAMNKDIPIFTIFRSTFPFIGACIVLTVLLIYFPQISVWLPSMMMGG